MTKLKFKKFEVGTVFNPLSKKFTGLKPQKRLVKLSYPSRLNSMAIDPSKIATNNNMIFTPGEITFAIKIYKKFTIQTTNNKGEIKISKTTQRPALVKHATLLMTKALNVDQGLFIDVDNQNEMKHCGFGSSSSLISGIAVAINEMFGRPIETKELVKYLAQNHGEEIVGDDNNIQQVQCIGGSAASGMYKGGLFVIAGESQVIKSMNIDPVYKVVIGIPLGYKGTEDAEVLMREEEKNLIKFVRTGRTYGKEIAYRVLHEVLPAMNEGNLKPAGDLIFDYRFKMGSIRNCSFVYPPIEKIAKKISFLKEKQIADVLSLSSVGPSFFAITKSPGIVKETFEKEKMKVIVTEIENDSYKLLSRN